MSRVLERARAAASGADWPLAHRLFIEADGSTPLAGEDLPLFAAVAYAAGHLDVAIESWERAHAASLRAGDRLAAARAAARVAMHLILDTALLAPVRGWLSRVERLLDGEAETDVHAWLAVARSYERFLSGAVDGARASARRAIDVGAVHEPAAAAIGRVAEARSLILQGEVACGLELLNDAGVATLSGEIDPLSQGVVYCELVCALQGLGQYDLAEQWTEAMERWHQGLSVGSLHGRCRVHRAEILRLRGAVADAEREALLACDELRPYLRRELGWPLTELGRIRLRRGDLQGAESAFLAADRAGWDPQPGPALLDLARGNAPGASASIRAALDRPGLVPSKERPPNTPLRRAPLLEAQVPIAIAAGDVACARSAADELTAIASRFQSAGLRAGAALARGRVLLAERDFDGACTEFAAAAHQWQEIGAPYETAVARMGLGHALQGAGRDDQSRSELRAAIDTFERIGAVAETSGPTGAPDADHEAPSRSADENVFRDVGDYWSLVFRGQAISVRNSKGLRYLSRLIGEPGREFHALDLVALEGAAGEAGAPLSRVSAGGDAGEVLDARAKAAYRRRLTEIDADLSEAGATGDLSRRAQAEAEREILMRELSRAVGLGGRSRRTGSASERARSAVTRAVRHAMARIRTHHAALGRHLDHSIRTGTYFIYAPDPNSPVTWRCR